MKKVLKVIGIIVLVFIILIILLFVNSAFTPMVPNDYTEKTETGGVIEAKYLKNRKYIILVNWKKKIKNILLLCL